MARPDKRRRPLLWAGGVLLALGLAALAIVPPSTGQVPGFDGAPEGIAERAVVEVDGAELTVIIRGRSAELPVVLLLGGGPGIPGYLMECLRPTDLAESFVVAYPEYRGTGLSRTGDEDPASLDTDRYLADVEAITRYLSNRFEQDRILLLGHSFGTYLGMLAAQAHPEQYTAYVAMSQVADSRSMETAAHAEMIRLYEARGDDRMADRLRSHDLGTDEGYHAWTVSKDRDTAMHALGGGTTRDMDNVMTGIFLPSLRCPVYTQAERIALWQGKFASHSYAVTTDSRAWNGPESVQRLDLPFYVLAGRHDLTTYQPHQRDFFDRIDAPVRGFYTFEDSAHSPLFEEPDKAKRILLDDVLRSRTDLADR